MKCFNGNEVSYTRYPSCLCQSPVYGKKRKLIKKKFACTGNKIFFSQFCRFPGKVINKDNSFS